jgi:hypothetical protein
MRSLEPCSRQEGPYLLPSQSKDLEHFSLDGRGHSANLPSNEVIHRISKGCELILTHISRYIKDNCVKRYTFVLAYPEFWRKSYQSGCSLSQVLNLREWFNIGVDLCGPPLSPCPRAVGTKQMTWNGESEGAGDTGTSDLSKTPVLKRPGGTGEREGDTTTVDRSFQSNAHTSHFPPPQFVKHQYGQHRSTPYPVSFHPPIILTISFPLSERDLTTSAKDTHSTQLRRLNHNKSSSPSTKTHSSLLNIFCSCEHAHV